WPRRPRAGAPRGGRRRRRAAPLPPVDPRRGGARARPERRAVPAGRREGARARTDAALRAEASRRRGDTRRLRGGTRPSPAAPPRRKTRPGPARGEADEPAAARTARRVAHHPLPLGRALGGVDQRADVGAELLAARRHVPGELVLPAVHGERPPPRLGPRALRRARRAHLVRAPGVGGATTRVPGGLILGQRPLRPLQPSRPVALRLLGGVDIARGPPG